MEFDINNYLDSSSYLFYNELDLLLKNKNNENKNKFVQGYLRFLETDAKNIYNKNRHLVYDYEFSDFFQDCILLIYDLYEYDCVSKESDIKNLNITKFRWIMSNYMSRLLENHDINYKKSKNNLKKKFFELCDKLNKIPNIDELRDLLEISYKDGMELLSAIYPYNSVELEYVYDNPEDIILNKEWEKELKENVNGALGLLRENNRKVIKTKYGIINDNELNYPIDDEKKDAVVARELGTSRQNFAQRKEVSLSLIKKSSYGRKLQKLYNGE